MCFSLCPVSLSLPFFFCLVTDAVESKTSVTVLRIGSPTPSLELEIAEEVKAKKEAAAAEHSLSENEDNTGKDDKETNNEDDDDDDGADEEDSPNQSGSSRKSEDIKHVSVTIENFFMPQEAKQLAVDILNVAGITNPLQICIDYDYQRLVIANDHCYTSFTSPSQRKSTSLSTTNVPSSSPARRDLTAAIRSTKTKQIKTTSSNSSSSSTTTIAANQRTSNSTTETNSAKKVTKITPSATTDDGSADEDNELSADEDDENTESDSSYISPSESENDRDSDLDFNLNDRQSRVRKVPNRAKRLRQQQQHQQQQHKLLAAKAKKRHESSQDTTLVDDNSAKKRPPKAFKRRPTTTSTPLTNKSAKAIANRAINKSTKSDAVSDLTKDDTLSTSADTSTTSKVTQPDTKSCAEATPTSSQPIPKKDRKPPAHVEALMSDMTSLFSTPDIIKKVSVTATSTATSTIVTPTTLSVASTVPPPALVTTNKPYFMSQPPTASTTTKHIGLSQQQPPIPSAQRNNDLATEQDKQLELIDSIVQQDLKEASPTKATSMNADIPKIVKMLECPGTESANVIASFNSPPTTTILAAVTAAAMPTSSTSLPFTTSGTINTELLDDSDLLAGLGNADDTGLTEDLLQHVAKLVQDKNLQEVIDKQVLGVEPNSVTSSVPKPPQQLLVPEQPSPKPIETKSLVTANTGKEPIKIIRSNGRVITLPPIEAPTTRGAKRRAQSLPTTDQDTKRKPVVDKVPIDAKVTQPPTAKQTSSVLGVTAAAAAAATATKTVTPKPSTKAKDRRSAAQRKAVEVTPVKKLDEDDDDEDDDEDDDSDGTYNSEDDPNR